MTQEPGDEAPEVVLCDACSERMTNPKNWLGTLPLDKPFDCVICMRMCCQHLRKAGDVSICTNCGDTE